MSSQVSGFVLYLSRDYIGVAPDLDGTVSGCYVDVSAYYGTTDVTYSCTYGISESSSITGSWDLVNMRYTVSKLTGAQGYVRFTAVYNGVITVSKTFTISRVTEGEAGRTYMLEASHDVIRIMDHYGQLSTDQVVFNAYEFTGLASTREPFDGRFTIERTTDGGSYETIYESTADESECVYQATAYFVDSDDYCITDSDDYALLTGDTDDTAVRVTLYAPGGFESVISVKTVVYIREAEALTPEQCFNILTNNGEAKGIIRTGNQLYISMDYLSSGTVRTGLLKSADNSNWWNLDTGEMKLSSSTAVGNTTLGTMSNNINLTAQGLQAEILRASGEEGSLSTQISAVAGELDLKITSAEAQTLINASADAIRLKTGTLVWSATNSSLSETGVLRTTSNAGQSSERSTQMSGGRIQFYKGNTLTGGIMPSSWYYGSDNEGILLYATYSGKYIALGRQRTQGGSISPIVLVNNGISTYDQDTIAVALKGNTWIEGTLRVGAGSNGNVVLDGSPTVNFGTIPIYQEMINYHEVLWSSGPFALIGSASQYQHIDGCRLFVDTNAKIGMDLSVGNDLSTSGNVSIGGKLNLTGSQGAGYRATIGGNLSVTGYITTGTSGTSNLGPTKVTGYFETTSTAKIGSSLTVATNTTISGDRIKLDNVNFYEVDQRLVGGGYLCRIDRPLMLGNPAYQSGFQLIVGGNVKVNGTITQTSDERIKRVEDWPDETDAILDDLEPIAFRWTDKHLGADLHFGLSAQAVRKVFDAHDVEADGIAP